MQNHSISKILLIAALACPLNSLALSGQAYMDRFNQFMNWYQHIPIYPQGEFLEFVQGTTPLSNKLRDKWLYGLARTKNWTAYTTYYQPTDDINLVCYQQIALYNLGKKQEALAGSAPIWLTATSQPQACTNLFTMLLKDDNFDQNLITQRIVLALDKHNISLANYLIKQYKQPQPEALEMLKQVYARPSDITKLKPNLLHDDFYLYGLKRIAYTNMDQALKLWTEARLKHQLKEPQSQAFLSHIALYKAMRNSPDTFFWFTKIKPVYYTDLLLDWQIRFALKNMNWARVANLINKSNNKDTPCWQYWLARALEEQGKKEEARALYEPLAKSRQYYGFLASMRLNKKPSFENERPTSDLSVLKPYVSVVNEIRSLYLSKHIPQASRLLNDFISELPKDEASALIYWVDNTLGWRAKSVYLSNNEILNNQLSLRFPLAYKSTVKTYAQQYRIDPELVYAIIRQESSFREDAVSGAGARGLMQVMPRTASLVSKIGKIDYQNDKQLFVSHKNINIGIAYLQQLGKRFSNHPILIAAAYNAGPRQVVYWLKNHPPKDVDIWIETLPWQETRNYLKNVTAFYVVYQYRLNQKPNWDHFLAPL